MTAREMIDSLSGTLLCDERILSVPERELLANLLQRTRNHVSASESAVTEVITRTVGEIIAERALGVLGESMTRQLLQQQLTSSLKRSLPAIRAATPGVPPPGPGPSTRIAHLEPAHHQSPLAPRRLRRRVLLLRTRHARQAPVRHQFHSQPPLRNRKREESPSSSPTITCPPNVWFSTSSLPRPS